MFQNSFQNGNYFQLYDPKISQDKQKNLFKIVNISNIANTKIFDKQLKTYVLEFRTSNAKLIFPKQDKKDLYLIQQYLVLQLYFFHSQPWSMELVISDLNKVPTKRRIMLSSTNNKLQIKPFFVKSPCADWKQGCWNNFAVDLYSFIEAFKGQTYRCLDSITIMGHFRLRRIYTTNMLPHTDNVEHDQSLKQISLLPKGFYFPPQIHQTSILTRYNGETLSQANLYQPTEPSTKNNSSYLKSTKNNRISTPKTETTKSEKIVHVSNSLHKNDSIKVEKKQQDRFLANTNGPQMLNRMRKRQQYVESSDSQSHITDNIQTPQSTQKTDLKPKKKLIKTQIMPPKARTSVQRRPKPINVQQKREKQKLKSKLNPWRTNIKPHGENSASKNHNKNESDNQQQLSTSPKITSNNLTKNNTKSGFTSSISKGFDRKSDHYSESQYIELSQKFSTLTDGKFFTRNNPSKNDPIAGAKSLVQRKDEQLQENTQEIEQNIQMQSNSIYSPSNEKQHYYTNINNNNNNRQSLNNNAKRNNHNSRLSPSRLPQLINESICDSLDKKSPEKDFEHFGKQSYYGFADRLMNEYMKEKERAYSPPMREKLYTEEEQELNIEQQKQLDRDNKEVELVYDPVLNCYYDHKTHTYYELKN